LSQARLWDEKQRELQVAARKQICEVSIIQLCSPASHVLTLQQKQKLIEKVKMGGPTSSRT
jgi:hypothetical protein